MQTIAQNMAIINLYQPLTRSNDSSMSYANCTYFSMKGYNKATIIVNTGAMTEASTIFKAHQAKAVAGTSASATALGMTHYWTNNASVSTTNLTRTAATSSQMIVNATANATYMFEVDAKQLNANSSFDCIGIAITGLSTTTCLNVQAILHDARYAADPMIINAETN